MKNLVFIIACVAMSFQANSKNSINSTIDTVDDLATADQINIIDTVWDILNVLYDGGKIAYGYVTTNPAMVSSGTLDLGMDCIAMCIPGVPAGSSKLAAYAVKEGAEVVVRTGGKQAVKAAVKETSQKYTKEMAKAFIEHACKRHGAKYATGGAGKFLVSSTDEIAELFIKAQQRIRAGHANIQFSGPTGAINYIVDMGTTVGKYSQRYSKSSGHAFKGTNFVSIVVNPTSKKFFGSFCPVKPNQISKEVRGFLNYTNW